MHASDLEPLNIFERYAFALACIERLCDTWGVSEDPFVVEMIAAHWTLVGRHLLAGLLPDGTRTSWWTEMREYALRPDELEVRLQPGSLSLDQVHSLYHALSELRRLPSRDMNAKPQVHGSAVHALNIVGILMRWGIEAPPLTMFRIEGYPPGKFGYGTRTYVRADFFREVGESA